MALDNEQIVRQAYQIAEARSSSPSSA